MKLGKKAKVEDIDNPHRPKFGLRRNHTVCRITMESSIPKEEDAEFDMQVDADEEPTFIREMESLIPAKDRFRDNIYEMWFIHPKHKETILDIAPDYFSETLIINGDGTSQKIQGKTTSV